MPVDSLQRSGETGDAGRHPDGRFAKGRSGNPAGRPRGSKNNATLLAQALVEGETEALLRKTVELALGGNALALKLCVERILAPRRHRPVGLDMPQLHEAADLAAAMAAIAAATAQGDITPTEAVDLARVIDTAIRARQASEAERRFRNFWGGGRS